MIVKVWIYISKKVKSENCLAFVGGMSALRLLKHLIQHNFGRPESNE